MSNLFLDVDQGVSSSIVFMIGGVDFISLRCAFLSWYLFPEHKYIH